MCRICGRMVKCIFDSMPSRSPMSTSTRAFSTVARSTRTRSRTQHVSSRQLLQAAFKLDFPSILQHEATLAPQFQNTQPLVPPTEPGKATSDDSSPSPVRVKHVYTQGLPGSNLPEEEARMRHNPRDAIEGPLNDVQDHTGAVVESQADSEHTTVTSTPKTPSKPLVLSRSLQTLLPALHAQRPHYITAHIHRFPYLITEGDTLRLPFHMHGVRPGDILRFNRASLLGSRDYTLKAGTRSRQTSEKKTNELNYLDERLFECRVRILGVDSQPMTIKEKKKRRNRRVRTVKSKHKYTVCKVMDVKVKSLEELQGSGDVLILE